VEEKTIRCLYKYLYIHKLQNDNQHQGERVTILQNEETNLEPIGIEFETLESVLLGIFRPASGQIEGAAVAVHLLYAAWCHLVLCESACQLQCLCVALNGCMWVRGEKASTLLLQTVELCHCT
jgi:hypothetical protein